AGSRQRPVQTTHPADPPLGSPQRIGGGKVTEVLYDPTGGVPREAPCLAAARGDRLPLGRRALRHPIAPSPPFRRAHRLFYLHVAIMLSAEHGGKRASPVARRTSHLLGALA